MLAKLQEKFQTRFYSVDSHLTRVSSLKELQPSAPVNPHRRQPQATRGGNIGFAYRRDCAAERWRRQFGRHRSRTPSRRCAIGTSRFIRSASGLEQMPHDVEINDATVAPRAMADSRLSATVTFHQRGYAGRKSTLTVRDRRQSAELARNHVWRGREQSNRRRFYSTPAMPAPRRCNSRLIRCPARKIAPTTPSPGWSTWTSDKRRILYVEGEPRWEYKFIRRAEDDDQHRAGRVHAAHHREQDLSPGHQRSEGTGQWLPYQHRGSFRLPGADHRLGGSGIFHTRAAGD